MLSADQKISDLENLKNSAHGEVQSDSFMNPAKKGRGRPAGAKNKPKGTDKGAIPLDAATGTGGVLPGNQALADLEATKSFVKPVFQVASSVAVSLADDDKAALGVQELDILVNCAANCINRYLPNILGAHPDLIVLSLTMSQWMLRVYMLRQASIARIRQKDAEMQAGQGPARDLGGLPH